MTSWTMPSFLSTWFTRLTRHVDARIQELLHALLIGICFTQERRRTAASWFRAGEIGGEFRRAYQAIGSAGRQAPALACTVLVDVENSPVVADDERIVFALDDTPSKRYGPKVEGAGLHHNPTPGPAQQEFVYGHSWVTLARLASHPEHGTIALPVRAELYVRAKDVACLPKERGWQFCTKLAQAAELVHWVSIWLKHKDKPIGLVVDGGYAKRPVLQAARDDGIGVVSRLRKDAALRGLPEKQPPGKRGRKPIYGQAVISLAKRAGHQAGWQTEEMALYGKKVTKTYKTFLATWRPAGGVIRVVLVREEHGWVAFFATKPDATPAEILGLVADRGSIEQTFKDVKEVWGAGQQQLRNLHGNIGAWHLNLWMYTLVELWGWEKPAAQLVDRSASPWDAELRRPSHADRRKALLRSCLHEEYQAALRGPDQHEKLQQFSQRLLKLAA
jgi:hypothetical protein